MAGKDHRGLRGRKGYCAETEGKGECPARAPRFCGLAEASGTTEMLPLAHPLDQDSGSHRIVTYALRV